LLRHRASQLQGLLRWTDFGLVASVFLAALWASHGPQIVRAWPAGRAELALVAVAACLTWPILLDWAGLYRSQRRRSLAQVLGQLAVASVLPTAATAMVTALIQTPLGPRFAFACAAAQLAVLMAQRTLVFSVLRLARRSGRNVRYVVVVGSGPRAVDVTRRIMDHREWGMRVIAYVDDAGAAISPEIPPSMVHKPVDFERLLADHVVDEVIVACPWSMATCVGEIAAFCAVTGVPLTLLSDLFGEFLPPPRVSRLGRDLTLSFAAVHHGRIERAIKRGFDLVGASAALLLAAPLIAVAAIAVRLDSPGPAFFRQVRCGLHGRKFRMLKLRTMFDGAEALQEELADRNEMDGPVFKVRDDPRVTRVGRILRRFSIDETPQLWNVLRGEMSLVGPRPPLPWEVSQYDPAHRRRLSMRPGLTCLWQVSGRNAIGFDEWVKLDLEYIDRWSLAFDAALLLRTIPAVLSGRGAS